MSKRNMPPPSAGSGSLGNGSVPGTEPDRLVQRAAHALRQHVQGEHAGAGFTRARVINSLHRKRRRRLVNWLLLSPALALLVGGSAWAQATHQWPVIWQTVQTVATRSVQLLVGSNERGPSRTPAPPTAQASDGRSGESAAPARSEASSPGDVGAELPVERPVADPALPRRAPETAQRRAQVATQRPPVDEVAAKDTQDSKLARDARSPSDSNRTAPDVSKASARDAENVAFRRAYDLDHRASHHAALDAYDDYLRQFPDGRFALEARYSRALLLIRLGRHEQARIALEPFANGTYGTYRRGAARRLLKAIATK